MPSEIKTVLLITDQFEPTADLLVAELGRRKVPCVRWNLDHFPLGSALTYHASNSCLRVEVSTDRRRVDFADVGSVWCRSLHATGFPEGIERIDRKFFETEARRALTALTTIENLLWINHPSRQLVASSKPVQLFGARDTGFEIPFTIISNDPEAIRGFVSRSKRPVVYKSLSQSLSLESGKPLFTGLLTEKEMGKLDLIRFSPGIFQEYIPKAYEIRVTVVGQRFFTVKIDSQALPDAMLDWRRSVFDVDYQPIEIPTELESRIQSFMARFGLLYAAFDFIVTPDERYVFLEVNPAGQYMWIESKTGLQITAALADVLIRPCQP